MPNSTLSPVGTFPLLGGSEPSVTGFLYLVDGLSSGDPAAWFVASDELVAGASFPGCAGAGMLLLFGDGPPPTSEVAEVYRNLMGAQAIQSGITWVLGGSPLSPSCYKACIRFVPTGTERTTVIPFGHIALCIGRGAGITVGETAISFANQSLTAPTIVMASNPLEETGARTPFGTIGPSIVSPEYSLSSSGATVSFEPGSFGCWRFELTLERDSGKNLKSDMDHLGVEIRYLTEHDAPLSHPIIDTTAGAVTVAASLDPLSLFDPARSNFAPSGVPLPSFFRTRCGGVITLTATDNATFVFSRWRHGGSYLVPTGTFSIGFPDRFGPGPADILLGLTGTEFFEFASSYGASLTFQPGIAARVSGPERSEPSETAWISATAGSDAQLTYVSCNPNSLFFRIPRKDEPVWNPLLPHRMFYDGPTGSPPAPIVPFAGIRERTGTATVPGAGAFPKDFFGLYRHADRLHHEKRVNLFGVADVPPSGGEEIWGVSASGLIVGFDPSLVHFRSLILAVDQNRSPAEFQNLTGPFKDAIRSRDLFLVMTDAVNSLDLECFTAPPTIPMMYGDWMFDLSPSKWGEHQTILIMKFHSGSIRDLAADPSLWRWPAAGGPGAPSMLGQIMEEILESTDADFAFIQSVVADPEWQGILIFNVPMNLSTIPPELAMLAPGIDPKRFFAHHLGIPFTSVNHLDEKGFPDINQSSNFGLINYRSTEAPVTYGNYGYTVTRLEVLIQNSISVEVRATVELQFDQLFGRAVTLANGNGSTICRLRGSSVAHDGHLNLTLSSDVPIVFSFENSVLETVTLDQAEFFMLNDPSTIMPGANPAVESRFRFSGGMRFVDLTSAKPNGFETEKFDLFSYDELCFRELRLDMSYPFQSPQQVTFSFDPDHLSFLPLTSKLRGNAIQNHLTLKPGSFASTLLGTPQSLAYMPLVVYPFKNATGIGQAWFGIVFELPLGSLGALSGHTLFSLELLFAWSPDPTGASPDSLWFGLRIPGANSSGVFFTLEDVVNLGVGEVMLQEEHGTPFLTFVDIGLTVLGLKFPPGGQTNLTLAGNDSGKAKFLGWLGTYTKEGI